MPAFPLHGWMPDGYKAMPLPVLAVFSGILSKVAAYGFLRVVLPVYPDASAHFQELMLLISLASILYGSVLAFTTPDSRLILGYSSVAQLGFITLGIFSLQDTGAQGALLQAFNHGLVVAPAFFIVALLAARAGGSEDIREMGGIAFRAPVLATLFLIVALANLAMPGSSNFVGEFLILLGVFNAKIVIAIVAFIGVVLASVYTLRLFIRSMHNRVGPHVTSREIAFARRARDRAAGGGHPRPRALPAARAGPQRGLGQGLASGTRKALEPMTTPKGPHIDWAGLSPLLALLGAATLVLLIGLLRPRAVREVLVPLLALAGFARRHRPGHLAVRRAEGPHRRRAAPRRPHDRALVRVLRRRRGGGAAVVARGGAPRGGARRVLRAHAHLGRGHVGARRRAEPGDAVPRARAAVDPALRAVRDRDAPRDVARGRAEVPHHRLGRLGHAALRPGLPLRRDGLDRLRGHRARGGRRGRAIRCCSPASR